MTRTGKASAISHAPHESRCVAELTLSFSRSKTNRVPVPRNLQIIPGQPGFYHCISRCVRRAWLCGTDPVSERNYDHRRDWMVDRLRRLTDCFAIDVYAYAFMSNHYHLVVYVHPERLDGLAADDVVRRWKTAWNWKDPSRDIKVPTNVSSETVEMWRNRLADVSWFMKMLNEPIARLSNAEDECKGHFWESRFKSIPLLDDAALIACMAYVDLNPIKAGVALSPEESDFTSIQQRLRGENGAEKVTLSNAGEPSMGPVYGDHIVAPKTAIPLTQYADLIRETAATLETQTLARNIALLSKLGLRATGWHHAVSEFLSLYRSGVGGLQAYVEFMERTNRTRCQDLKGIKSLFMVD